MNELTSNQKEIIENLIEEGFSYSDIADAMEDGEYLRESCIDQDDAEAIHEFSRFFMI